MHSLTTSSVQCTGIMHVLFCRSLSIKAGWAFTRYNNEPMQDFGPKRGAWHYAVGVYLALYGTI